MFKTMRDDINAVKQRDPACEASFSIILNYPGLHALWAHRINHALYNAKMFTLARFGSQVARFFTGIEIHPGATIGKRLFIDHGMGVVIGETSIIGDDVTLYQGTTLGGTGKQVGKRHPTLENGVVVGVGASVLGAITIGEGSKVGGGAVVIADVPPHSTVVGIPGKIVMQSGKRVSDSEDGQRLESLPDPVVEMIRCMSNRLQHLETRVTAMQEGETFETPDIIPAPPSCFNEEILAKMPVETKKKIIETLNPQGERSDSQASVLEEGTQQKEAVR